MGGEQERVGDSRRVRICFAGRVVQGARVLREWLVVGLQESLEVQLGISRGERA